MSHIEPTKREIKMKFNSQICTSREQSKRLLTLGLKAETADMYYFWMGGNEYILKVDVDNIYKDQVEAPSEFIYNTKAYKKYPMVMNISQSNNIRRYQMRLSDYQLFYCNNEIEIKDNFFIITNDLSRYMGSKCLNEDGKYYKFENYNYKNKDKVYIKGDKLYKYLLHMD